VLQAGIKYYICNITSQKMYNIKPQSAFLLGL